MPNILKLQLVNGSDISSISLTSLIPNLEVKTSVMGHMIDLRVLSRFLKEQVRRKKKQSFAVQI